MKDLRDALRREAGKVWRDKNDAGKLRLFLSEETITETMLLRLAQKFQHGALRVRAFTKAQEKTNGADYEVWFIEKGKSLGLRVQAKRLFPSGNYDSLHSGGPQINKLISQSKDCCPVFAFYNDERLIYDDVPACECPDFHKPTYLGVTLASAKSVKASNTNRAATLTKSMIPWHCILCQENNSKKTNLPEAVKRNLSTKISSGDEAKVIQTPKKIASFAEAGAADMDKYLTERKLAGLVLISAAGESA